MKQSIITFTVYVPMTFVTLVYSSSKPHIIRQLCEKLKYYLALNANGVSHQPKSHRTTRVNDYESDMLTNPYSIVNITNKRRYSNSRPCY